MDRKILSPMEESTIPKWRIKNAVKVKTIDSHIDEIIGLLQKHKKSPKMENILIVKKLLDNILRIENEE